ncbi:vegetative cell wall protein gp1-like [Helianthus annuus]|uniref:vegetative cell wall protein gp1-like n=1 Tax=Helianthus annuus TaxID=4232 RepID=UPI000B8FC3E9|nr:vegetative cell wall protein gp1-like [Helianthus annuus]
MHPIVLSSDTTSYAGSPYQGPDEWDQYFNQFTFVYTPPYPPPQMPPPPQEDEPMEHAEQPQPPPQPRKPHGARMSMRAGQWSGSLPPLPPSYPTVPEDPQMAPMDYSYPAPPYDPYLQAVVHNALYPSPFPPAYPNAGYPNYGYQYPVVPQPQPP